MRRRSREGRSGKKMPVSLGVGDAETAVSQLQGALPAVRHARTRARGRERREGAAAPRQPHGCSGEGREREQQEGQEVRRRSREGRSGKKMPVSLGAGDAETAVSQPQGRRREDARTKRRSGSALPAVRLLGRRTGARATGGSGSSSTQPRGSERQEDAGVAGGWGRRDSGEPATGGPFLPCVTQERVREEENEEKERQRLASRKVARAKDGSASNRRARKCVDAAARVGAARRCRCRWGLGTPRQR